MQREIERCRWKFMIAFLSKVCRIEFQSNENFLKEGSYFYRRNIKWIFSNSIENDDICILDMSNGHAFKSVFSSCKIHTRNVSHFLFFDVTWNQIHFKLAFNIEILSFQIHFLWWLYIKCDKIGDLFHSWIILYFTVGPTFLVLAYVL